MYQTGTTTGAADLLGKLFTFAATTTGSWTIDDAVASDEGALHHTASASCFISFRYDATATTGRQLVGIYHALGHTPGELPGDHPDDSGSGYNDDSSVSEGDLEDERYVNLGLSADEVANVYHFFEEDTAARAYIHIVIVQADGSHRHFGFGTSIDKFGTWTGGSYCYGHRVRDNSGGGATHYSSSSLGVLLDGRFVGGSPGTGAYPEQFPTLHIEGFPGEDAASKWGEICAARGSYDATDDAGELRFKIQGGYRGGLIPAAFGNIATNRSSGFSNTLPIHLLAFDAEVDPTPDKVYYLGEMPDVHGIILDGISPGEEIQRGSETWVCFPSLKKSSADDDHTTLWQGIAYRKETA